MKKITRTHDAFYLKESRYEKPKQMFADIIETIKKTNSEDTPDSPPPPVFFLTSVALLASFLTHFVAHSQMR